MFAQRIATLSANPLFPEFTLALDFKNGVYRSGSALARDPLILPGATFTRAGAKLELSSSSVLCPFSANVPGLVPGDGIWIRGAVTNLLLNNAALSTQSVSVTAQAYTLSFFGTGTVTLSGTSTAGPLVGTGANNRVTLTFTPTAGTLTLTVSGSVTNAGLVAGSIPGPIIATAGASATTALDSLMLSQPIPIDEDWLFWAVVNCQTAAAVTESLLVVSDGTSTNRFSLTRGASGTASVAQIAGGVSQASFGTLSGPQTVAGRAVFMLRRRAGKVTPALKNSAGTVTLGTETTGTTFPSGLSRIDIGNSVAGNAAANALIEFVGYRRGTFSDADCTAILAAA